MTKRSTAACAALAALALAGCGGAPGRDSRPPIVLVSIDTLRSDHLPAYGYRGVETPAIDALAADGVRFEHAYSPIPTTLPAHASMLTGLDPPRHGIRLNMGYALDEGTTPYLPAALGELGYATGAAVSSYVLRGDTGLARGFDFYQDAIELEGEALRRSQRAGSETLAAARDWLAGVADRPFFFFLHLYEPHVPHDPPPPFAERYPLAYDGEIAEADRVVGELLSALREAGVYGRALIILTADHGEGLGDHLEDEHGIFLYRESLQVPLILKLPEAERAGAVSGVPAQLSDLTPTVLELLGAAPPAGLDGRSLLAAARGEGDGEERDLYAESWYGRVYFGWSELVSLIRGRYHYVHSPSPELFDLVEDPGERRNLLAERRDLAAAFRRRLVELDVGFAEPGEADLETRRRLASLGYLGMSASSPQGALPAAHTQAHLLPALREALTSARAGRHAEAASSLRAVLAENPNIAVAWPALARALERSGRPREALAAYGRAVGVAGDLPAVAVEAARLAFGLRELASAREYARRARAVDPLEADRLLVQIELAAGDRALARELAEAVLARRPDDSVTLLNLAQVERADGAPGRALELVRRAAGARGAEPLQGLHLLEASLLAVLGRPSEAETALRAEIDAFPRDPRAYARLAELLERQGRGAELEGLMRALVAADGSDRGYAAAVRTLAGLGRDELAAELLREGRQRFPGSALLSGAASR